MSQQWWESREWRPHEIARIIATKNQVPPEEVMTAIGALCFGRPSQSENGKARRVIISWTEDQKDARDLINDVQAMTESLGLIASGCNPLVWEAGGDKFFTKKPR